MTAVNDLIGRRFGRLLVIGRASNNKRGRAMWLCMCDCGTIIVVDGCSLLREHTTSCKCYYIDSRLGENNVAKRPEVQAKISKGLEGRPYSAKTRAKIGDANRGEKSGKWITDRSKLKGSIAHQIRESTEGKAWKKMVLARDCYICNDCITMGLEVQAHHLFSFVKWEELRFDLDNGVTLCEECHDKYKHKGTYDHRR